jgi:glutamyl-tRNA reductase
VQYIIKNVEDIGNKKTYYFWYGKIGRNTCENLVKHTKNEHITLINRTKSKAEKLAGKLNLIVKIIQNCILNYKSGCCCGGHWCTKSNN